MGDYFKKRGEVVRPLGTLMRIFWLKFPCLAYHVNLESFVSGPPVNLPFLVHLVFLNHGTPWASRCSIRIGMSL